VVPKESVYPPDRTEEQIQQANRQAFLTSEESAEAAALGELGYPEKVVVRGVSGDDSPSDGVLEEGDAIESVDGEPTPDPDTLTAVLTGIPAGTAVQVGYTRLGQPGTATVTTGAAPDREGSVLGVTVREQPRRPSTSTSTWPTSAAPRRA
jgi:PDZ domain-containing protein